MMNSHYLYLASLLLLIGASLVRSEDAKEKDPDAEACKKEVRIYFKKIHKTYIDCHATVKENTTSLEEQFEMLGAISLTHIVDDKEMVTDDLLKETVKNRVTPKYEEKLLSRFMECKKLHGDKLDKNDEKCVEYKEYGLCMQMALSHVCYE